MKMDPPQNIGEVISKSYFMLMHFLVRKFSLIYFQTIRKFHHGVRTGHF